VEGSTDDDEVINCRERRKRSLISTLFLSQGVPMILGGDELSRTQGGNNNAYCQDNEINWYDWDLDEREEKFLRFVQRASAFRKRHPTFRRRHFLKGTRDENDSTDAHWWHPNGHEMTEEDWSDAELTTFGLLLRGDRIRHVDRYGEPQADDTFLILFNRGEEEVEVALPSASDAGVSDGLTWTPVPEFQADLPDTSYDGGTAVEVLPHMLVVLRADRPKAATNGASSA
jgi:glycogen operon protein